MQLDTEGATERVGVSRNMSPSGLLMATATKLQVGQSVKLTFGVPPLDPTDRTLVGRVLRTMPNDQDPTGMWPILVAVEFTEPDEELRTLLEAAAERFGKR